MMTVKVPEVAVDELMTREEFTKMLEDAVNSENSRIIRQAAYVVSTTNAGLQSDLLAAINKLAILQLDNPALTEGALLHLTAVSNKLSELATTFNVALAASEATYAKSH